ncbi:MAG: ATP-binding cassette domain-containing protein [Candidatus Dormibacteraceae bacterium]
MIAVEHLRKRFGSHEALADVSFTVPKGEIFGFVGPNGAGKTTTIRVLATLTRGDSGEVSVGGIPIGSDPAAVRAMVGYMPDFFGVYDRLTSREYLDFYAACHGVPHQRRRRVADELLELVDLGEKAESAVDTLSRGMKQRLCLARSLVHGPEILLLDEPASGLDPRARVEMRELIRELRRMGKTVLISSHILPELEELCTWIGFIDGGRMAASGPLGAVRDLVGAGRRLRIQLAGGPGPDGPGVTAEGLEEGPPAPEDPRLTRVREMVLGRPGVAAAHVVGDHVDVAVADPSDDHELLAWLVGRGVEVRSFAPVPGDLSEAFMRLTGEGPE